MKDKTENIDAVLGSNIYRIRKGKGLSQEYLALELGYAASQVSHWEQGKAQMKAVTLYQMSKVLNTEIGIFFKEVENTDA